MQSESIAVPAEDLGVDASLLEGLLSGDTTPTEFKLDTSVSIGGRAFALVPMSNGEILELTDKQAVFFDELMRSLNPLTAAKKAEVSLVTVRRWFATKKIRDYFDKLKRQRAASNGLTVDYAQNLAYEVLEGARDLTKAQQAVFGLVYKGLGLADRGKAILDGADSFLIVARKGSINGDNVRLESEADKVIEVRPDRLKADG